MNKVRVLLLTPGLILILFFLFFPLLSMVVPTLEFSSFPFEQYIHFFQNSYQSTIFWRTIRVAALVTVICICFGIPTAYYVSGISKKWKGILMAVTLFPMLTNSVVRSFAWITILGKNGVVNQLLLSLQIIEKPLSLLYTEFAIIIGSVYLFLPTMIITLVGVMDTIDKEIVEAAQTLGSSHLTVFRKIIVPLSIPGTIVGSILVFTGTLTAYTTPQLLGGNKRMLMATFLRQSAMTLGDWQSASVVAFIMILSTIIVMQILHFIAKKMDKRIEMEGI